MTKQVLERFPNIRFVLAHAGGVLPFLAWRLAIPRVPPVWQSDVHEKLRNFWYDIALAAGKSSLLCVKEIAAPERILFGTDWPYTSETTVEWTVRDSMAPGLFTAREQDDVNTNNGLALFPRLKTKLSNARK